MRQAKNIPYLLVERYDREVEGDRIRRIHQEDFCQAMGILTSKKYQNEGGPGLKECFDILRETTTPVVDRNRLAQVVVFNYLIGNNDAHGKNFSLLHRSLRPAYSGVNDSERVIRLN
jgi:serine/threonine-protein kinase HipA